MCQSFAVSEPAALEEPTTHDRAALGASLHLTNHCGNTFTRPSTTRGMLLAFTFINFVGCCIHYIDQIHQTPLPYCKLDSVYHIKQLWSAQHPIVRSQISDH